MSRSEPPSGPLRLAILASSLPPASIGGAEIQAQATAIRLARRGHQVTVFARAVEGEPPGTTDSEGVTWIRTGGSLSRLGFPGHVAAFRSAWNTAGRPAACILAFQTVIPGVLGALAQGSDRPLTTWIRSEGEIDLAASRKYRVLTPWVLKRSRRILVQSSRIGRRLVDEIRRARGDAAAGDIERRLSVLGNAVTVDPPGAAMTPAGLVFVGRLVPEKGFDVLLAALHIMASPPPVAVYGDGPLRADWERAARGLPVTFHGAVQPGQVRSVVAGAVALVAPSHSEGFPNAVLEAMERGVPPVASAVGGVPDVVTDGRSGLLVPPGDAEALADALTRVTTDPALRARLAAGARSEGERHGWEPYLDQLETLLRD